MQEERPSFWPKKITWIKSIPPPGEDNRSRAEKWFGIFTPFAHACAGLFASVLYLYLSWILFDHYIAKILALSLIVITYASFLLILWKADLKIAYWFMLLCVGILIGMIMMQRILA
ncbi:MAG: hypothetical protein ACOYUZ_03985 [Patescibacteria group bacterium]